MLAHVRSASGLSSQSSHAFFANENLRTADGAAELGDLLLVGEGFAGRFKRLEDFVEHGDVGVDGSPVALLLELLFSNSSF